LLGSGPIVVIALFLVRLRPVAVKFENMEASFDITSMEPTMVVVHNKRGYNHKITSLPKKVSWWSRRIAYFVFTIEQKKQIHRDLLESTAMFVTALGNWECHGYFRTSMEILQNMEALFKKASKGPMNIYIFLGLIHLYWLTFHNDNI